ncbi:MAG: fluoride efflux transporter CrcB [Chitinophagaceae bacterium]|nr:fluoride efflux transporter CrcB [Chitinophagaceae bacterium]MCW5904719.1 fluoride efflux transporter CrcB [Chitinophagaceae bacterium]
MIWKNILLVGFGGGAGSIVRYLVYILVKHKNFPYSTFIVNIIGSFFIGTMMAYYTKQNVSAEQWKLLIVTGFLGGFTTFSAFSWDTLQLLQQQRYSIALLYIIATFLLSFIAVFVGYKLFC